MTILIPSLALVHQMHGDRSSSFLSPSWQQKLPPGPSPFKYGWLYFAERCNFLNFARRLIREYGDIVHVQIGSRHHFIINHPDYIEKILMAGYKIRTSRPRTLRHTLGRGLITSQGELHSTMRRLIQPYFQKQTLISNLELIAAETEKTMAKWKEGQVIDVAEDMMYLTVAVITNILFGGAFTDEEMIKKIGKAMYLVHLYSHQDPASHINMWIEYIPWIGPFTGPARARRFLDEHIYGLIKSRRNEKNFDGPDLLSAFLKIQQMHPEIRDLNDKQIRDELFTTYLAGHETSASALAWTFYLISQHPDVERKLHEEVDRVLSGRLPTIDDIAKLSYTNMVFSEAMRIYPPVWTLGRRPEGEDFTLGDYVIPNKSMILISPYLAHHDERFWPDPEKFDPERFRPEEEAKRHKFSYFPFAKGNRKCLGESLAWMEGVAILSAIAQYWRLKFVEGHPIEMEPLISLKPKYGVRMILERRRPKNNLPPGARTTQDHVKPVCPVHHTTV